MSLRKMLTGIFAVALNLISQKLVRTQEPSVELRVGDVAPDFVLPGSDGRTYRLADFRGEKIVVLAWFPKAFTPGCTRECRVFAEQSDVFANLPVAFFTASVDSPAENKKFAESLRAQYPILSDPDRKAALAYGVVTTPRDFARRWTFIIGIDGKILHIDKSVKVDTHARDVANWIKEYLKAYPIAPGGPTP
ncbi:MAG: peroxiredoxin [Thermogutta sp.]